MSTRSAYPLLSSQDMTASENVDLPLTANYGFFIQWNWSGLTGSAKIKFQASIDGTNWTDYPINDGGSVVYELTITGAADNGAFTVNNWYADNLRVVYDADTASAGTINASITFIDNQDTH